MGKMNKINKISEEEVKHIAKLANLSLEEKEIGKLQKQLSETIGYIKVLDELDTENVEPTNQVSQLINISRQDEIKSSLSQEEALANGSSSSKGYFKVKAILDKENEG